MKKTIAIKLLKSAYPDLSDKDLVKIIAEKLDVNINPVKEIHELEDSPQKCFVWNTEMTDQQIVEFSNQVRSEFVKKYNTEPQALHFIRNDINEIEELNPEEVQSRVEPWLKSND